MNPEDLRWDKIAVSDEFREAPKLIQNKMRFAWLDEVAPVMVPGYREDPKVKAETQEFVRQFRLPDKLPHEDEIIRPDTLREEGIATIEENPEFARLKRDEQQAIRSIWYHKMSVNDPDFASLPWEKQKAYYERLMSRPPSYSSGIAHSLWDNKSGFFMPVRYNADNSVDWEEVIKREHVISSNLINSFARGVGALITAPLKALTGPDSGISRVLADLQKEREWLNDTSAYNSALNEVLPSVVGEIGGIIAGPYGKLMRGLAGGTKLVKGASGARSVARTAGLFEKGAKAVLPKMPQLVPQVAGGATAGAIYGVSAAIHENRPWDTYLLTDATLGVGVEFLTRYFGALRQIKRAANEMGVEMDKMLRRPFDVRGGHVASDEMAAIMRANPEMAPLVDFVQGTDADGVLRKWTETLDGVSAKADILDFKINKVDDGIELKAKDSDELIKKFTGPEQKQIYDANAWLDQQDDIWEKRLGTSRKSTYEAIATAPTVELRRASFVPTKARKQVIKTLEEHDINMGIDYSIDPRGDTSAVDELYTIIYKRSPSKASEILSKRNIIFSENPKENKAIIKQLKSDLEKITPKSPYLILNTETSKVVHPHDMPTVIVDHPNLSQPFYHSNVYTANPRDIRGLLNVMVKKQKATKSAITKQSHGTNIQTQKVADEDAVEMLVKVPGMDNQVHEAILHFPSYAQARNYLTEAKGKGLKGIADVLRRDDDMVRKSYESFVKAFKKSQPQRFKEESMPFNFVSKMAKDNDYYLAVYKGKYILQDALDINDVRYTSFDTLDDVITFLKNTPRHVLRPEMVKNVSAESAEMLGHNLKDPLEDIPYEEVKSRRHYGVTAWFELETRPTAYAVQYLEKMEAGKMIRQNFDTSVTRLYNVMEDSNRLRSAFEQDRRAFIRNVRKRYNIKGEDQADFIKRWMEALDTPDEAVIDGLQYEIKDDVVEEMVQRYGRHHADEMIEAGVEMTKFFDDLFSVSGLPFSMYIKHYAPHYSEMLARNKGKISPGLDPHSITQIPDPDKAVFFEMLRDINHTDVMWERDIFKLADIYAHLMGRNLFVRPALKQVKGELKRILEGMESLNPSTDDYKMVVHYMSNVMNSIAGTASPAERGAQYAMSRTVQELTESLDKVGLGKISFKSSDPISKLITLSTGAHIAARPWPIARNLTQSLITGGSFIGPKWWMEGVSKLMDDPRQLMRLMDLGVIEKIQMPTGAGYSINPEGIIAKAMEGYKFADWINRAIVYLGMESRVDDAIARYSSGALSGKRFVREAGAKLFGKAEYNEARRLLVTAADRKAGYTAFKDRLANLATARTQYLYHKFDTPELFRNGVGRLFGQYTTWPLNFLNFVRSATFSDSMNVVDRVKILTSLGLITTAIAKGAHDAGINPRSFIPWEMGMVGPGPYYKMLNDGILAINGDQRAYANLVDNLTAFLPFVYAGEGIWRAVDAFKDGDLMEGFLLLSSTPIRYDMYPRRETPIDTVKDAMMKGGQKYFEVKNRNPYGEAK